jgi:hypothetical protein
MLGVALGVPGCGSTYQATRLSRPPLEETDKVVYKDMSLRSRLAVMDVIQDEVNGMLRVRAKLKHTGRGLLNAEVKVKFVDKDGMEFGQEGPWLPLPIGGGEIRTFEGIASSSQAADWRILVQLGGTR